MSSKKMYITVIILAIIVTVTSGVFLAYTFFWRSAEELEPDFMENGQVEDYIETTPEPESEADNPVDVTPVPEEPTETDNDNTGFEHLAFYGSIQWHTLPTWDFHQVFPFNEGMAGVEYFQDGIWESMHILGYINTAGEIVIPIEHLHYPQMYAYRGAPPFSQGLVAIRSEDHQAMGVFDTQGRIVVPFDYDWGWSFSEGLMAVRRGGWEQLPGGEWDDTSVWGFIDQEGNEVIPMQFDHAVDFNNGLAAVMRDGYWGFINTSGEVVIPFNINVVHDDGHGFLIYPRYSYGRIAVSIGGWEENEYGHWMDNTLWGFIDSEGNQVVPFMYTMASPFSDGLAVVRTGTHSHIGADGEFVESTTRWGAIDVYGNVVVPFEFGGISAFRYGASAVSGLDGTFSSAIIDRSGNFIVEPGRYHVINNFSEGMVSVNRVEGTTITGLGFLDTHGNEVIPLIFDHALEFSQGFAAVRMGSWEEGANWGIIDMDGNIVVPFVFDEIRSFSEGLAWVRYGDLWGLLKIATG